MKNTSPPADQGSQYPEDILEPGIEIIRANAERAARQGRTKDMIDYLAAERRLLEGEHHDSP